MLHSHQSTLDSPSSSAQFTNPAEWGAVEEDCDRKWTYDARVMLINEIRARPAFWVTSQRGKRRNPYLRQLRSEVAQRVSMKFGFKVTCDDVAQQWKYLNRHHKIYLKNRARFEKDAHLKSCKYPAFRYAKYMDFLEERNDDSIKQSISNEQQQAQDDTSIWSISFDGTHDNSHKEVPLLLPQRDTYGDCLLLSSDTERTDTVQKELDTSLAENVSEHAVQAVNGGQVSLPKEDENDQLGKTVASALRRAAAQDATLARRFRIDVTRMLFALEEKIFNAYFDKGIVSAETESRNCCLMDSIRGECDVGVGMRRHKLTRRDPPLASFCEILNDKVAFEEFLVLMRLMPQSALSGDSRICHGTCVLSMNCTGLMYTAHSKGRPAYRCDRCGKVQSVGHGDINGGESRSFFYRVDEFGRPHTRISREAILWIVYCTAREISSADMVRLADRKFRVTKVTVIDWQSQLRDLMRKELECRPPLGGQNRAVRVDEFQGRREEEGYGNRETGSWIFGMLDMTTKERRFFHVPHRDAKTLMSIIQRNIAPGSTIVSSGLEAYRGIEGAPNMFYRHRIDKEPVNLFTDSNAPFVETVWRALQSRISKTSPALLKGNLVLQWWLSLNGKQVAADPFLRLCDLIAKYFPQ